MNKYRFSLLTLFVVVTIIAVTIGLIPHAWNALVGFDRGLHANFNHIKIGDTRSEVIALLEVPLSAGPEFPRQLENYDDKRDESVKSGTVEYLVWANGVNWYYCVGIDANAKVVFKCDGHS